MADCTNMGDELAISIEQWVLFYILKSRPSYPPRLLTCLPFRHPRPLNSESVTSIPSPEVGRKLSPGFDIGLSGACCYLMRPVASCLGAAGEQEQSVLAAVRGPVSEVVESVVELDLLVFSLAAGGALGDSRLARDAGVGLRLRVGGGRQLAVAERARRAVAEGVARGLECRML